MSVLGCDTFPRPQRVSASGSGKSGWCRRDLVAQLDGVKAFKESLYAIEENGVTDTRFGGSGGGTYFSLFVFIIQITLLFPHRGSMVLIFSLYRPTITQLNKPGRRSYTSTIPPVNSSNPSHHNPPTTIIQIERPRNARRIRD